ncbi:hypothetical protein RHMOL_Rhmol04G0202000 [Rhododendron molle]|uniref:Uncharacterized protein n=1 Tax=Rhododendron molle TaxID=49168 RepID=A0ACC0P3P7_RHOML|nr:hypothetical protein RHMOL_Rhmol04G0202000 [Rhododendron molle]
MQESKKKEKRMPNSPVIPTLETSCKKEKGNLRGRATCTKGALRCRRDITQPRKITIPHTSATPEAPHHGSKLPMQGSLIKQQDRIESNADSLRDHWPHFTHPLGPTGMKQSKGEKAPRWNSQRRENEEKRKKKMKTKRRGYGLL